MRIAHLLAASSAVMALSFAVPATAQEWAGWHGGVIAGTATERSSSEYDPYGIDLAPAGSVYGVAGGHRFEGVLDDWVLGVDAAVIFGSVEATGTAVSCTVPDCGFNETVRYTRKTTLTGRFGGSIGHEAGPLLVYVGGGIEARNYIESFDFDADGGFDDYGVEQTRIFVGPYVKVGALWPVNDRVSVALEWVRSEPIDSKTVWNDGFETETGIAVDQIELLLGLRF